MTTRLLESFKALDSYSKRVLEKHAKKNCQLSVPYSAYDKGNMALELDYDLDFLNPKTSIYKPKSNTECFGEERDSLPKRLRISKSSAAATSLNGSSSIKSVEVFCSKINLCPFTSNENSVCWTSSTNVKSLARSSMRQDEEEEEIGFMIMSLRKPQSLRPYRRSPHRVKWSSEVENIPSLYALNKDNSKAMVGSSLGYTDTSHWCSSSVNNSNNVNGTLKVPGSCEIMVTQDLQQGNLAKICTSVSQKNTTGENPEKAFTPEQLSSTDEEVAFELVPLSFEDELERKNVKVLTSCPTSVYEALPIVSETYPVVYRPQQHQHEPFSSPGFHSLDSPEPLTQDSALRKSSVYSTIIHNTESIQADYMLRNLRERQTGEGLQCSRSYPESGLKVKRKGAYRVNLHLLSADGNVVKSPDLGPHPLHNPRDASFSLPTNKGPVNPLVMPKRKGFSFTSVGPVINGKNPSLTCNPGEIPSAYFKPWQSPPKRRLSSRCYTPAPQTQQSTARHPKNKPNFLLISNPVKCSQKGVKDIITKRQTYKEEWSKKAPQLGGKVMSQVASGETFGTHEMSFSTPTSVDCMIHSTTTSVKRTDPVATEDTSNLSYSLHRPQPINIPTAESEN